MDRAGLDLSPMMGISRGLDSGVMPSITRGMRDLLPPDRTGYLGNPPAVAGNRTLDETGMAHRGDYSFVASASGFLAGLGSQCNGRLQVGVGDEMYHCWRPVDRGLEPGAVRPLLSLEEEDALIRKIIADQAVDISILRIVARI